MRELIRLSAQLESTRIDADKQCAINMHPHSDGGYEQDAGLVEFATYAGPSSNGDFDDLIATQISTPLSLSYNSDGSKLMILDDGERVYQYSCFPSGGQPSTYDSRSLNLSAVDPVSIQMTSDTAMFVLSTSTGGIKQYTGTANQIDTFTDASNDYSLPGITGTLQDFFTDNGANFLIRTSTGTFHYTYNFVSALVLESSTTSVQLNFFTESGKSFFNSSTQYRTNTAWDLANVYEVGDLALEDASVPASPSAFVVRPFNGNFVSVGQGGASGRWYVSWSSTDLQGVAGGDFRGAEVMGGVPYLIFGNSLLSFSSAGVWVAYAGADVGPSGSDQAITDTDGTNLVIVVAANTYRFSLLNGMETVSDSDISGTVSTAYLDSTFYYPVGDQIFASDVGDPTTVGSLNFISAESFTDNIVRNFSLNQLHYSFGTSTIEVHFTNGAGNTRLGRQKVLEHGIIGKFAVDSIDDTIYFVDEQRRLSRIRGLEYAPIKVKGLGPEFESYSTVSDCIVSAFASEQENYIDVTFPTQDVTWRIHEDSGEVFKAEDTSGSRVRSAAYLNVYGDTFSVDRANGKVYQFSASNYQEDGNTITRTLFSEKITSENFGWASREFSMDTLYLGYDCSGSSDITIAVSTDSGATFDNAQTITVNGRGIHRLAPQWGQAVEFIARVQTTANQKVDILSLAGEPGPSDD